jgi:hypothetical protein
MDVRRVAGLALCGVLVLTGADLCDHSSGSGSDQQEQSDPSDKFEYQCSDGSYHIGRKALDRHLADHPNVICKRVV